MWQRYWTDRGADFRLLGVAQEAHGPAPVAALAAQYGVTFPVLVDETSLLGRVLGFRVVPSGCFVGLDRVIRYRHLDDFDIADPRVRLNLERFLAGEPCEAVDDVAPIDRAALKLFAAGVAEQLAGRRVQALDRWREALALDPDNFVIRSQIWVAEHPKRFYPVVDRNWQELRLLEEGYDKPLP